MSHAFHCVLELDAETVEADVDTHAITIAKAAKFFEQSPTWARRRPSRPRSRSR